MWNFKLHQTRNKQPVSATKFSIQIHKLKIKETLNIIKPLTPANVVFSCRAFWQLRALSGLKYVRNAQPAIKILKRNEEGLLSLH